jgi:hypothetical protein
MQHFCTLFDSNYLIRGLALYESLQRIKIEFKLYIVCFDKLAFTILSKLSLESVVLIQLAEFESPELLHVKPTRTTGEYCWTCTPHVIRYILDEFKLKEVTYLDADLYFYGSPLMLLDEFHDHQASVLITEHRYTPKYDKTSTSGIYCVQFMTFMNDSRGIRVLQWWQERCLEWCYNRFEEGRFGDQKYLDAWTEVFEGVHVLRHLGGGVAPWNIQQYTLAAGPSVNGVKMIFYHFHALNWHNNNKFNLGGYDISSDVVSIIYRPYLESLKRQLALVRTVLPTFERGIVKDDWHDWKTPLRIIKRWAFRKLGVYREKFIQG